VVTGSVYIVAPGMVLRPFLEPGDNATIELARTLLLIGIVLQFFDAAQNIGAGLLRGLKETNAGFRLSLVGYWLVGLPTALLLAFPLGLGAAGVWWGLTAGLATTAALMLRRYFTLLDTKERAHPHLIPESLPSAG
jgi:MATE family multidrug resistance protein